MSDLSATGSHRFALVNVVAQRADELSLGAPPLVRVDTFDKHVSTALREVEAGVLVDRRGRRIDDEIADTTGEPDAPAGTEAAWAS